MFVLFEEDGHFRAGSLLAETEATAQVEALSGKRSKIKQAAILLRFSAPAPAEVLREAERLTGELDADFLWEVAGSEEFGFIELAREYHGRDPGPAEALAMLQALHATPVYFHRRGKGRYRAAPADVLAAAKAGLEKKRQAAEKQARLVAQLVEGTMPAEIAAHLPRLLIAPDKNTLEYKALDEAASQLGLSPVRLAERCGALGDPLEFHRAAFTLEWFPRGTGFPAVPPPVVPAGLETAATAAFSIDDASTTEIDDAFSLLWRPDGGVRLGIHIAAPALGIPPGSPLDTLARQRLSTVYFPGDKITMLPEDAVTAYTLAEGGERPALSLYVEVAADLRILATETRIESVPIAANLRIDALEAVFNEGTLAQPDAPDFPYRRELEWLHRLACTLEAGRGKTDTPDRIDYTFRIADGRVDIVPRKRGNPIDRLVSELMIFANAHWGGWLAEHKVPGIYRAQANGKTRMTTAPDPHQGLGVDQYAWSTSPLRRYVDLVNQRQLISLVRGEAPPHAPRTPELFAIVRDFELAYDAYAEYQRKLERYWVLRWLMQENVREVDATVIREDLVRFDTLPWIMRTASVAGLAPGTPVRLALSGIDLVDITLHAERVEPVQTADCPSTDVHATDAP